MCLDRLKVLITPEEERKLLYVFGAFSFAGLLLFLLPVGRLVWVLFAAAAVLWYMYEKRKAQTALVRKALWFGIVLLVFDYVIETFGAVTGLWTTNSYGAVGYVPLEILAVTFFGGMAWALFQPKKPSTLFSAKQLGLLAFFGTIGEYILTLNGLMVYGHGWSSLHAFFLWLFTWILMAFVWQNLLLGKRELLGSWKV